MFSDLRSTDGVGSLVCVGGSYELVVQTSNFVDVDDHVQLPVTIHAAQLTSLDEPISGDEAIKTLIRQGFIVFHVDDLPTGRVDTAATVERIELDGSYQPIDLNRWQGFSQTWHIGFLLKK